MNTLSVASNDDSQGLIKIFFIPEISQIIDLFLDDDDKITMLSLSSLSRSFTGLKIHRLIELNYGKAYIFSTLAELRVSCNRLPYSNSYIPPGVRFITVDRLKHNISEKESFDIYERISRLPKIINVHINVFHIPPEFPPQITSINICNCSELKEGQIPWTVKKINFKYYDHTIKKGVIPGSVIKIIFNDIFSLSIEKGAIPDSVEIIVFNSFPKDSLHS